jgi:hypothetical protein
MDEICLFLMKFVYRVALAYFDFCSKGGTIMKFKL